MEVASLPEASVAENVPEEPIAAAQIPTSKLFEWSGYVHVGEGAETCDKALTNTCENPDHFHAWVCLANAFQVRDIGDKARAAKARKIRALRDSGQDGREATDSYVTLEAQLEERAQDMDAVIDEIVQESVAKQLPVLYKELEEEEEFENANQDSEELARQTALPEDERDPEEYEQLQKAQDAFASALEHRVMDRKDRERESLEGLPREHVIEQLRKKRINEQASEMYMHTYYTWLMFIGTRTCARHNTRLFEKIGDLKMAAPEVIAALREKVNDLEDRIDRGSGGSKN
jgi:hypothetical protein